MTKNFNLQVPYYDYIWNIITSVIFLPQSNVNPGYPTPFLDMTCDAKMYSRFSESLKAKVLQSPYIFSFLLCF